MQSITTSVLARILLSALLALIFTMSVCAQTNTKTKVACIGDSLTRGYLLEDAQSYPAQLQQQLRGGNIAVEDPCHEVIVQQPEAVQNGFGFRRKGGMGFDFCVHGLPASIQKEI